MRSDPQSPVHCSHVPSHISELKADVPRMYDRYKELVSVHENHTETDYSHYIVEKDQIKGLRYTYLNNNNRAIFLESKKS